MKPWGELNSVDKEPYIERAKYLISRGYLDEKNIFALAKKIYEKDHK